MPLPANPFRGPQPIPLNNPVRATVQFFDENNVYFDPDSNIQIRVVDPHGVEKRYLFPGDVVKVSVGVYWVMVQLGIVGDWIFTGTGIINGFTVTTPDIVQTVMATVVP